MRDNYLKKLETIVELGGNCIGPRCEGCPFLHQCAEDMVTGKGIKPEEVLQRALDSIARIVIMEDESEIPESD